jgi:hypothetical protein
MVYDGLSLISTQITEDQFVGYFTQGLIEIPAGICAPLLLLWFGRKTVLIIGSVTSAVCFTTICFVPEGAAREFTYIASLHYRRPRVDSTSTICKRQMRQSIRVPVRVSARNRTIPDDRSVSIFIRVLLRIQKCRQRAA